MVRVAAGMGSPWGVWVLFESMKISLSIFRSEIGSLKPRMTMRHLDLCRYFLVEYAQGSVGDPKPMPEEIASSTSHQVIYGDWTH